MKNLILTTLFLVTCITLMAQNSWLGGNGDWNNIQKWSEGTVPTANDIVIINNGTVEISSGTLASALRLRIYGTGGLDIKSGGRLTIDGILSSSLHGVILHGNITVRGQLVIRNIGNGDGITTDFGGSLSVTSSGYLSIRDVAGNGIRNTANLNNSGLLSIRGAGNRGILNYGVIDNAGKLTIQYSNGGIFCWTDANIVNNGNLTIHGCNLAILLRSNSTAINMHDGQMTINHAGFYGIQLDDDNNNFFNFGTINMTLGQKEIGIDNQGFFHNNNSGDIQINVANTGVKNWANAVFWNDGAVSVLSNIINQSIWNEGEFVNFSCGELNSEYLWRNLPTGTIENEGNWYHDASMNSINNGLVVNTGTIEDYQGTFPSFTNEEIRARPITGTVAVGELVYNALDVALVNRYTIEGWYTSASLTQSAGRYSVSQNIWQPNWHAAGLTEVFVNLIHNSGDCDVVVRVQIPAGVTSLSALALSNTTTVEHADQLIYPNPSNGSFTVEILDQQEGIGDFQLFDLTGRMLWQAEQQFGSPFILTVPSELESGIYQLAIRSNGELLGTERLVIER